jgi:hypothetical protein
LKLQIEVKKEMDGKFKVSYRWRSWENWKRKVCDLKEAQEFILELTNNPHWTPYKWWD